jgi:hypothetical protein
LLYPVGGRAPHREASVPVVVPHHHQERALAADEKGRRTVAETFTRLGEGEADRPDPLQDVIGRLSDSGNLRSDAPATLQS